MIRIHFNHKDWERIPKGDVDGETRIEHYHPALTWCAQHQIKYKVYKKNLEVEYGIDGFDIDPWDTDQWKYQIGFHNANDAVMFKLTWGEIL